MLDAMNDPSVTTTRCSNKRNARSKSTLARVSSRTNTRKDFRSIGVESLYQIERLTEMSLEENMVTISCFFGNVSELERVKLSTSDFLSEMQA